eukprot:56913_1
MATQLRRITTSVCKLRQFSIYKSAHSRQSCFIAQPSVRTGSSVVHVVYGGLITIAFGTSYVLSTKDRNVLCACGYVYAPQQVTHSKSYSILNTLRVLAPDVNANRMLSIFQDVLYSRGENEVTLEFVIELFQRCGVTDDRIARELFRILDLYAECKIAPEKLACCFTLFQTGSKVDRYRFMFKCIDLQHSNKVNKEQFREFYEMMLEMKYRLRGIEEDEEEYTFGANSTVEKIFQHNQINIDEFLHWCSKGESEVALLDETLSYVCKK